MRCKLLDCTHYFHYPCILEWAHVNRVCPCCKVPFNRVKFCDTDRVIDVASIVSGSSSSSGKKRIFEDYPHEDDDDNDDYEECDECGVACIEENVYCNCGACVHLFCIGRR